MIIESFWKSILNDQNNIKKLKNLYENLSANPKPEYNIGDYINSIDQIVRKVETELGIQDREIKITKSPSREWCTCDDDSDIGSKAASVINHTDERNKIDPTLNQTANVGSK